jgi:hypothetical protein
MVRYDRISSLFWMVIAAYICVESIRLGPGSLSTPGSGLFPLGCGLTIGILGIIAFIRTFKGMAERQKVLWQQDTQWGKLISMLTSIIGYAFWSTHWDLFWLRSFGWVSSVQGWGK